MSPHLGLKCTVDDAIQVHIDEAACSHARCCEEADLASLTWISYAEQLYTDAAFMLDASTRVTAAAGSCLIDVHLHCVVATCRWVVSRETTMLMSCEEVDLARRRRARCICTSRTPRPALTAPRHDVTAALSGLAEQGFGATFDATRLHARRRDGAHRGRRFVRLSLHYRYTPRCV